MSYKRIFWSMLLLALAGACKPLPSADLDADLKAEAKGRHIYTRGENEIYNYCSYNRPFSLEKQIQGSTAIFIGKATERHLELPGFPINNRCFVKFDVLDVLKGKLEKTVWVMAMYPHIPASDFYDPKNCYLKKGKTYLISGRYAETGNKMGFVIAAKDPSSKEIWTCAAVEDLSQNPSILSKVKSVLKME